MNIEILSPNKSLYKGSVSLAKFPGVSGSFEVLKNHAPIISNLEEGQIKLIDDNQQTHYFDVKAGFVEVINNEISVLISEV